MKKSIAAIVLATVALTSVSQVSVSPLSSSMQGTHQVLIENNISAANPIPGTINLGYVKTTGSQTNDTPMQVAWGIKSIAKKIGLIF